MFVTNKYARLVLLSLLAFTVLAFLGTFGAEVAFAGNNEFGMWGDWCSK